METSKEQRSTFPLLRHEDSYSSFEYDEFGTVESCHSDRIVIKPLKPDLPLDVVLFDCIGNFIGPVSELLGHSLAARYIVRIDDDAVFRLKRNKLKPGDCLYYYNCDRLHIPHDQEEIKNELGLMELKRNRRDLRKKHSNSTKIGRSIMDGVIENLREMKVEVRRRDSEQLIEEEQKSTSKNSKNIATIVLNSYYNPNFGSRVEKKKAKKYKKIKARVLGGLNKPIDELIQTPVKHDMKIENELLLGKRGNKSQMVKRDSFFNTSTDYSKNSYEADRKQDIFLGKKTPSENHMHQDYMLEEDPLFVPPSSQMAQENNKPAENSTYHLQSLFFTQE